MKPQTLVFEFFSRGDGIEWRALCIHGILFFGLWIALTALFAYIASLLGKIAVFLVLVFSVLFAVSHVIQWFIVSYEKSVNGKWKILSIITVFSSLMAVVVEWFREGVAHTYRKKSKGE